MHEKVQKCQKWLFSPRGMAYFLEGSQDLGLCIKCTKCALVRTSKTLKAKAKNTSKCLFSTGWAKWPAPEVNGRPPAAKSLKLYSLGQKSA